MGLSVRELERGRVDVQDVVGREVRGGIGGELLLSVVDLGVGW